jgi:arsenate reductase
MTLYGIPNCDTVKKARTWLTEQGIDYVFHDYKKEGITPEKLASWLAQKDWTVLVNTRGTTWRQLSEAEKAAASSPGGALELMLTQHSVIKRPVIETDHILAVGFDAQEWNGIKQEMAI